jgi:glycosyltransferase involved in cell wall biosynthesis
VTDFDVAIFMTYLYTTTTRGLPALAGRVPTILQPTAHDEPSIWATAFDTLLRLPDAYLYFTPSERTFMEHRLHRPTEGSVVGIGIDQYEVADPTMFRRAHDLGERPYLLYVGRIDGGKGTDEAARFFAAYKDRNPCDLQLVMAGELIGESRRHPEVVYTGYLDEDMKRSAMAGSLALLQPSYFESFSIVLCESWVQGRPALVQDGCAVLGSQVRRANGGLPYTGFATFEASVDLLRSNASLADQLGLAGQRFVRETYEWPSVLSEVEAVIERAVARFALRRGHRSV